VDTVIVGWVGGSASPLFLDDFNMTVDGFYTPLLNIGS